MNFGLLGDYDALPDIDRIADGIEASLAELVALARRRAAEQARADGAPTGARARRRSTVRPRRRATRASALAGGGSRLPAWSTAIV